MATVSDRTARRTAKVRRNVRRAAGERARLSVFRSSKHIYAQVIDDLKGDSMIYLELVEDFKKKYDVKVEIALIGRYLQKHPVYTVGQTAGVVYDIVERGDNLLASEGA